jgi:HPt (histidine-containing phosphotransfer) domain-containing protein
MNDYLAKPLKLDALVRLVSQWLALDEDQSDEPTAPVPADLGGWDALEETASDGVEEADPAEARGEMEAGKPSNNDGYDLEIRARAERAIAASLTHATASDGVGTPESAAEMLIDEAVLDQMRADTGDDIVSMLVTSFLEELSDRLPKVSELCEAENWTELRHEAHTIKGSAATFGAAALSKAAKRIEVACDDSEFDVAKRDVEAFPGLAQKTRDSLIKTLKLQLPSKKAAA